MISALKENKYYMYILTCLGYVIGNVENIYSHQVFLEIKPLFFNKHKNYENYFVKGHYFDLNKKINAKHWYYPKPTKLGLGVHLTIDLSDAVRFGPDTVETNDAFNYSQEALDSDMFTKVAKNFSGFEKKDLTFSYSGIGPKLKKNDKIVDDFLVTYMKFYPAL